MPLHEIDLNSPFQAKELKENTQQKKNEASKKELERMMAALDTEISPGSLDRFLPVLYERPYTLFDHLPEDGLVMLSDPAACI